MVLRLVLRVHEDVVNVAEHEVESLGDFDKPLECLAGVAGAKTREGELEEAERCDDGRLGYVRLAHRYLGISLTISMTEKTEHPRRRWEQSWMCFGGYLSGTVRALR